MDTVVEYGCQRYPEPFGVPAGVTRLTIEVRGAAGSYDSPYVLGGSGMIVRGMLAVTPGQVLTVAVGCHGDWGFVSGGQGGWNGSGATGVSIGPAVLLVGGGGGGAGSGGEGGGNAYLGTPGPSNDGKSVPNWVPGGPRRGGRAGAAEAGSAAMTAPWQKEDRGGGGGGGYDPLSGLGCGEAGENGVWSVVSSAGGGGGASYLAPSLTSQSSASSSEANGQVTIRFTGPADATPQRFACSTSPALYTVPDQATMLHVKATGGAGESTLVPVRGGQVVDVAALCRAASAKTSALRIYPLWGTVQPCPAAGYGSTTCYDPKTASTVPPFRMTTPLYRLVNNSVDHLFTTSTTERDSVVQNSGFSPEGIAAYVAPDARAGLVPLYRLFNPAAGDHLLTVHPAERDHLTQIGWSLDGTVGYVAPAAQPGLVALYRLFHAGVGRHHATVDRAERDQLTRSGWSLDGTFGYLVAPW